MRILIALVLVCLASGCGGPAAPPAAAPPTGAVPASTVGVTLLPVSDEEAQAFADRFVEALNKGDSAALVALLDLDALAARCGEGVNLPTSSSINVRTAVQGAISGPSGLATQIHDYMTKGGSYRLLRIHEVDGRKRAMFRMLHPSAGVNYHDLVLSKGVNGAVRGVDIHVFLAGEMLSETMKRMLLPLAAHENRSLVDRMAGREQSFVKHFDQITKIMQSLKDGKPAEGIAAFKALPAEVQREKVVLLARFRVAAELGDDNEYQQAIADFRTHHPSDPCVEFLSIDYYYTRKEFEQMLAAIERVDKSVGGDPYLDVMRAGALGEMNRDDDAEKTLQAAVAAEPELQDAWWAIVTSQLKRSLFDKALETLKQIDQRFQPQWEDLTTLDLYAEFVKSPQYQEWLKYREPKSP